MAGIRLESERIPPKAGQEGWYVCTCVNQLGMNLDQRGNGSLHFTVNYKYITRISVISGRAVECYGTGHGN